MRYYYLLIISILIYGVVSEILLNQQVHVITESGDYIITFAKVGRPSVRVEESEYVKIITLFRVTPQLESTNATITFYIKLVGVKLKYDDIILWVRSSLSETKGWYPIMLTLKVGVAYKVTLTYPDVVVIKPKPEYIDVIKPQNWKLSPRISYLHIVSSTQVKVCNGTVIIRS